MLEFTETRMKLEHVNGRNEIHGHDQQLFADLKCTLKIANSFLDHLQAGLKESLYCKVNSDQGELLEDEGHLTALRFPEMSPFSWDYKGAGYAATIHRGALGAANIDLAELGVDKFKLEPQEGGSVVFTFRIAAPVTPEQIGELYGLMGHDIDLTLTPPAADEVVQDDMDLAAA